MTGPIVIPPIKRAHKAFAARHDAMVDQAAYDAGRAGVLYVQQCPRFKPQTGDTQRATEHKIIRTGKGRLVRLLNRKPWAAALDKGAKPHRIRARRAPFLSFYWPKAGKWMRIKSVNHPGNKPYRFLHSAHLAAYKLAGKKLSAGMAKIARQF